MEKAARGFGIATEQLAREVDVLIHGTTLATSALLTGRGARVGMLTTNNFRDIVELRRGFKNVHASMFNVFVPPYRPLVPRRLRLGVEDRSLHTAACGGQSGTAPWTTPLPRVNGRSAHRMVEQASAVAW